MPTSSNLILYLYMSRESAVRPIETGSSLAAAHMHHEALRVLAINTVRLFEHGCLDGMARHVRLDRMYAHLPSWINEVTSFIRRSAWRVWQWQRWS